MTQRRKLIEVDLPLDAINDASVHEKSVPRRGHPATLHLYWARRPLAACRAVIFASLVDDPASCPEEFTSERSQRRERERLHAMIRELVKWENTDESRPEARALLRKARYEIARSVARGRSEAAPTDPHAVLDYLGEHAPPLHDPFAGGGSIPLEAQRLGLRAIASDLNPLAVLINKALIELPPKFRNQPPVNPNADPLGMTTGKGRKAQRVAWRGAAGLADDIRYYGRWMRGEAYKRIGHLYPKAKLPDGGEATVIAWLWARTVPCPNPACGVRMPLLRTFQLSTRKNKTYDNRHWTRPVVDRKAKTISFVVQDNDHGVPKDGTVNRTGVVCLVCQSAVPLTYVRQRARDRELGSQMTAIVAEGNRRRLFFSPDEEHIDAVLNARPKWRPAQEMPDTPTLVSGRGYGITHWHQLFTDRQLETITTFSEILSSLRTRMKQQGVEESYAVAIMTYLTFALSKLADWSSSFCSWIVRIEGVRCTFARQAIPMVWDYTEINPLSDSVGNFANHVEWVAEVVERFTTHANPGKAYQEDVAVAIPQEEPIITADPPYYDNIDYADLSDFFYVWLRPLLRDVFPDLFAGILTPKNEEIVAIPSRFKDSRLRFENLLGKSLSQMRENGSSEFPVSIFYAYKQQEEMRGSRASTGWETMLNAVISAGFQIVGTWPMRTERTGRSNAISANALASSVVLVCRPRPDNAPPASRRQFLDGLAHELPRALDQLTHEGHIAPTDLAQAAIGPGMEVYSRHSRVETISGERVTVREALAAINEAIDAYEARQEGELDPETRFCLRWFRAHGHAEGGFGDAELMSQAGNVVVERLASEGLLTAGGGKVALRPLDDYHAKRSWPRGGMTAWEGCHRMAWHMNREAGELVAGAARVARAMDGDAESAERLARLLYSHYDKAGDSANAVIFNNLVTAWPAIQEEAQRLAEAPALLELNMDEHG